MPSYVPSRRVLAVALASAATATIGAAPAHGATVYAASSLSAVLGQIDGSQRYSFAGSNALQLQIERGAPADVFLSASPDEPQALYRHKLCSKPVTFATNRLVLAVPRSGSPIHSVADLRSGGRRISVGAPGVPIGDYTRKLLARMSMSSILESNTVSNEANVSQVVAKVALGSADAGFVYYSDAKFNGARLRGIALPRRYQPPVEYRLCTIRRPGVDSSGARAFIARVTGARGREILKQFGFGRPAKPKAKAKK